MKRYKQFDDLIIDDFELEKWNHPLHNHNHYEIIFIAKGKGKHLLNDRRLPYTAGDLYLLGPSDRHEFIIDSPTRFVYVKFTKRYLSHPSSLTVQETWNHMTDRLLRHPLRRRGSLIADEADKQKIAQLMKLILEENKDGNNGEVIYQLFIALLLMLIRNVREDVPGEHLADKPLTEELLEYIGQHIRNPTKLTVKHLSDRFYFSPNYLGAWFKKHMGTNLKSYISEYRLKLILQLLQTKKLNFKQIALEFGFVDESHLYKFVKSQTGKSLGEVAA